MPLVVANRRAYLPTILKAACTISLYAFAGFIFNYTAKHVQYPFIDEIFHLRQCQAYCSYNFKHWDHKITTPPGLYILGFLYSKTIELATGVAQLCQKYTVLRSLNLFAGLVVFPFVLGTIFKSRRPGEFWTINIVAQPLLFTYYFLFYTDVWSTILVTAALALVNSRPAQRPCMSAIFGFLSLWLRQTNIIWLAFIAAVYIDRKTPRSDASSSSLDRIYKFTITSIQNWARLLGYVANFAIFAAFVKYNGGITLGDKKNHQVQLHLVQVFYCFTFICFFTWPVLLHKRTLTNYARFLTGNYGVNLAFNAMSFWGIYYIIRNFTIVHPFLLADNRHYTFYIYRRLLSPKYSPFVATPMYHFASYSIVSSLSNAKSLSPITIMAFLVAVVLTIVPSPLFEPRYYIIPLIIFRLNVGPRYKYAHVGEFAWLMLINSLTSLVFFNYTFTWSSEPNTIQRIIW
ncbi:uncharacterized protein LODBEIA_P33460 [Lodderomyces beijingensis]|uniref:Dol-P-Glc:Glc(2)Man(9)GlcNAc(2)-PP-Dol alpha-1,2-glucosyltransferase n=1 Tax=Lodderomyces beijingensis TaxID=1775926 RepID=A0ABP0ZS67_9ASCO